MAAVIGSRRRGYLACAGSTRRVLADADDVATPEVKGFTSARRAEGLQTKGRTVQRGSNRLVERTLRHLHQRLLGPVRAILDRRDIAELEARVRRLRALGGPLRSVRLSDDVERGGAASKSLGVRGSVVGTEA